MTKGLSVAEVSELVGVSKNYIQNACARGELSHFRLGRRIIIDKVDLDKWMENKKVG